MFDKKYPEIKGLERTYSSRGRWQTIYPNSIKKITNAFSLEHIGKKGNFLKKEIHRLFDPLWNKKDISSKEKRELKTFWYEVIGAILENEEQTCNGWQGPFHMAKLNVDIEQKELNEFKQVPLVLDRVWRQWSEQDKKKLREFWKKNTNYTVRANHNLILLIRNQIRGINTDEKVLAGKEAKNVCGTRQLEVVSFREEKRKEETASFPKVRKKRIKQKGAKTKTIQKVNTDITDEVLRGLKAQDYAKFVELQTKAEAYMVNLQKLKNQNIQYVTEGKYKAEVESLLRQLRDTYKQILTYGYDEDLYIWARFCEKGINSDDKGEQVKEALDYYLQAYKRNMDKNKTLVFNMDTVLSNINEDVFCKEMYKPIIPDIKSKVDRIWQALNENEKEKKPELLYLRMRIKHVDMMLQSYSVKKKQKILASIITDCCKVITLYSKNSDDNIFNEELAFSALDQGFHSLLTEQQAISDEAIYNQLKKACNNAYKDVCKLLLRQRNNPFAMLAVGTMYIDGLLSEDEEKNYTVAYLYFRKGYNIEDNEYTRNFCEVWGKNKQVKNFKEQLEAYLRGELIGDKILQSFLGQVALWLGEKVVSCDLEVKEDGEVIVKLSAVEQKTFKSFKDEAGSMVHENLASVENLGRSIRITSCILPQEEQKQLA